MITRRYRTFFGVFLVSLLLGNLCLSAQSTTDWRSWSSVAVNYKINKSLRFRGKAEYRLKDNLSETDRWSLTSGLHYKVLPFMEIKGSYELHHRHINDGAWKFRHRYNIGAQASWVFNSFKLSWRERFQQTIQSGDVESVLRSRLKLDYNIPGTRLQPHFSTEIFQRLDNTFPEIFWVRYRPGLKIGFTDKYSLLVFYCRQYEEHRKFNIMGIEMELNF